MYFAIVLDVGTGSLVKLWFLSWNVDFLPRFLKFLPAFCFVCGFVSGQLITRILVQECRRRKQCVESNLLTLRSTENRDVITGLGIRRFVLRQSVCDTLGPMLGTEALHSIAVEAVMLSQVSLAPWLRRYHGFSCVKVPTKAVHASVVWVGTLSDLSKYKYSMHWCNSFPGALWTGTVS